MLPGGEAALTRVRARAGGGVRIAVVDLATGVADTLGFGTNVAYASGYLVFSGADGTLQVQPFDPESRRTTGSFLAILDGIGTAGPMRAGQFGVSAEGGLAYQRGSQGTGDALIIEGPDGDVSALLTLPGNLEDPAFSPLDGRRIVTRFGGAVAGQHLWIFDRDQGTSLQLTTEGDVNMFPVWTPDGRRIAYMSHRAEASQGHIYWQAADLSASAEPLLTPEYGVRPGSWTPDGRALAIAGRPNGDLDIGLFTLGDSLPTWIVATEFDEHQPQISPDGRWLAFTSDRSGQPEVYVQELSGGGGQTLVSTAGGHSPRWAPDGAVLYYADGDQVNGTIIAAAVDTSDGFRVASREDSFEVNDLNPGTTINYDVGPDGEEFVHVRIGGTEGRDLVWILNWPEIVREMAGVN